MKTVRLAMVQMNAVVGDITNNMRAIQGWIREAKKAKSDIVVFPELAVSGYPPEDLLLMPQFLHEVGRMQQPLAKATKGIVAVVGGVSEANSPSHRSKPFKGKYQKPFNSAWVFCDGKLRGTYHKCKLPNYGVFDEERYFQPGTTTPIFQMGSHRVGINICEDIWFTDGPARDQIRMGQAGMLLNLNASPYHVGKMENRKSLLSDRAREYGVILSYTNMVGGQDELVFDGNSLLFDPSGEIIAQAKAFQEDMVIADLDLSSSGRNNKKIQKRQSRLNVPCISLGWKGTNRIRRKPWSPRTVNPMGQDEEIYRALVLGVTDYVRKNRFEKVLIGISGGIDSALTAAIACDAIGASNVVGIFMPSPYTSSLSRRDAKALSKNLGFPLETLSITKLFRTFLQLLQPTFGDRPPDTTEENLQARIRGILVMALSNKFGYLVLTTGNKSEMSVGYATLYGDMAGGFAVIKDLPKTRVFRLAKWRSAYQGDNLGPMKIPRSIQTRVPSAELKPDQADQDTLPPYPELDAILQFYVEDNWSKERIAKEGFTGEVVERVMRMVDLSEYKRRQAPLGIKITARGLGKDRRMPITNRFLSHRS